MGDLGRGQVFFGTTDHDMNPIQYLTYYITKKNIPLPHGDWSTEECSSLRMTHDGRVTSLVHWQHEQPIGSARAGYSLGLGGFEGRADFVGVAVGAEAEIVPL